MTRFILTVVCVLVAVQAVAMSSFDTKDSGSENSIVENKIAEPDYYSDIDEEFEKKTEDIRTAENWIIMAVLAVSFIGSIVLVIILIHLKSRKASGLLYLI